MTRLYLAGRWSNRENIQQKANQLKRMGFFITSRWHSDPNHLVFRDATSPEEIAWNDTLAHHDMEDLYSAEAIVYFAEHGSRGGSHVEFGMAIAWGKDLILVGPRSHVFTFFCQVICYETWEDFLEAAKTEGGTRHLKTVPAQAEIREGDGGQTRLEF